MYFWIALVVCAFVPAVWMCQLVWFPLLRRKPQPLTADESHQSVLPTQELDPHVRRPWAFGALFPLLLAACTAVLCFLHQGHLRRLPASHLLYATPWFLWMLPATSLSLNLLLSLIHALSKTQFLGGMPLPLSQGRLTDRGLLLVRIVLPIGFAAVSVGFTVAFMTWHVRLSEEEVGVCVPFSFEEKLYTYHQVRHVVQSTRNRNAGRSTQQTEVYVIVFDDGQVVEPFICRDVVLPDDKHRFVAFITAKTGKPLRVVQFPGEVMDLVSRKQP